MGGLEAYSNWPQVSLPAGHDGGRKKRGFVLFRLSFVLERSVKEEKNHTEADVLCVFCVHMVNSRVHKL